MMVLYVCSAGGTCSCPINAMDDRMDLYYAQYFLWVMLFGEFFAAECRGQKSVVVIPFFVILHKKSLKKCLIRRLFRRIARKIKIFLKRVLTSSGYCSIIGKPTCDGGRKTSAEGIDH